MLRNLSYVVMIVLLGGCGSESSEAEFEPCAVRETDGPLSSVDLLVSSALPAVFTENCPSGMVDELEIFLTVPGHESCFLNLTEGVVQGCCPGVATDQNAFAALIYRVPPGFTLGEQSQVIELPTTSESVVNVSFEAAAFDGSVYDGDNDGEDNIDEYCAGTLD